MIRQALLREGMTNLGADWSSSLLYGSFWIAGTLCLAESGRITASTSAYAEEGHSGTTR